MIDTASWEVLLLCRGELVTWAWTSLKDYYTLDEWENPF